MPLFSMNAVWFPICLLFLFYHNCEEISITVILQFDEISMKSIHPDICAIALYLKMKLRQILLMRLSHRIVKL